MAWSTCYVFNPQVRRARADGDAIIAGTNFGAENSDVGGHLDMDAVGVRAVSGCCDGNALCLDVLASIEHYVEHLAVN